MSPWILVLDLLKKVRTYDNKTLIMMIRNTNCIMRWDIGVERKEKNGKNGKRLALNQGDLGVPWSPRFGNPLTPR